ncbi:MAG TPA: hypothetical protein V6C71_20795 [Coleofasciculaceae cyanobacterium]|jgi:hypothetical protein
MFGKSPREPQKPTMSDLKDIKLSPPAATNLTSPQDTFLQTEEIVEDKEVVTTVEKISRIVSPYFIAIVGLALYENNFLIGTILIVVGILSLLKVSTKDVGNFLEWLKNFLGLK